jgi:hypothetical protein
MHYLILSPKEEQRIKNFLEELNFPAGVDLNKLLDEWENVVDNKLSDEDYAFDSFLNDLQQRKILDEIKHLLQKTSFQGLEDALQMIDEKYIRRTHKVNYCICGKTDERLNNYHKDIQWYFYRLPNTKKYISEPI